MANRINIPDKDENKNMVNKIEAICQVADTLYDLIAPGMTIEIRLPVRQDIIIPNKKPEIKTLYLTRPNVTLKIEPK